MALPAWKQQSDDKLNISTSSASSITSFAKMTLSSQGDEYSSFLQRLNKVETTVDVNVLPRLEMLEKSLSHHPVNPLLHPLSFMGVSATPPPCEALSSTPCLSDSLSKDIKVMIQSQETSTTTFVNYEHFMDNIDFVSDNNLRVDNVLLIDNNISLNYSSNTNTNTNTSINNSINTNTNHGSSSKKRRRYEVNIVPIRLMTEDRTELSYKCPAVSSSFFLSKPFHRFSYLLLIFCEKEYERQLRNDWMTQEAQQTILKYKQWKQPQRPGDGRSMTVCLYCGFADTTKNFSKHKKKDQPCPFELENNQIARRTLGDVHNDHQEVYIYIYLLSCGFILK